MDSLMSLYATLEENSRDISLKCVKPMVSHSCRQTPGRLSKMDARNVQAECGSTPSELPSENVLLKTKLNLKPLGNSVVQHGTDMRTDQDFLQINAFLDAIIVHQIA